MPDGSFRKRGDDQDPPLDLDDLASRAAALAADDRPDPTEMTLIAHALVRAGGPDASALAARATALAERPSDEIDIGPLVAELARSARIVALEATVKAQATQIAALQADGLFTRTMVTDLSSLVTSVVHGIDEFKGRYASHMHLVNGLTADGFTWEMRWARDVSNNWVESSHKVFELPEDGEVDAARFTSKPMPWTPDSGSGTDGRGVFWNTPH